MHHLINFLISYRLRWIHTLSCLFENLPVSYTTSLFGLTSLAFFVLKPPATEAARRKKKEMGKNKSPGC